MLAHHLPTYGCMYVRMYVCMYVCMYVMHTCVPMMHGRKISHFYTNRMKGGTFLVVHP